MIYTKIGDTAVIYKCNIIGITQKAVNIRQGYSKITGWLPKGRTMFRVHTDNKDLSNYVEFIDLSAHLSTQLIDIIIPEPILNNNIPEAIYQKDISFDDVKIIFGKDSSIVRYLSVLKMDNIPHSLDELKTKYRKAIKKYHPDMEEGDRNLFDQIQTAYYKIKHYMERNV